MVHRQIRAPNKQYRHSEIWLSIGARLFFPMVHWSDVKSEAEISERKKKKKRNKNNINIFHKLSLYPKRIIYILSFLLTAFFLTGTADLVERWLFLVTPDWIWGVAYCLTSIFALGVDLELIENLEFGKLADLDRCLNRSSPSNRLKQ